MPRFPNPQFGKRQRALASAPSAADCRLVRVDELITDPSGRRRQRVLRPLSLARSEAKPGALKQGIKAQQHAPNVIRAAGPKLVHCNALLATLMEDLKIVNVACP